MSFDADGVRKRFIRERPKYERAATGVQAELVTLLRRNGVVASVDARAKDVASLVKKSMRSNRKYASIQDKAGARIRLAYADDRDRAVKLVRDNFHVVSEDDKRASRDHRVFDYSGFHFIVKFAAERCLCEIQLHCPGESLWASTAHDLIYKEQQHVSTAVRRAMHRLSALTELFDAEVTRLRDELTRDDSAVDHNTLFELERTYWTLTGRAFDRELSLRLIPLYRTLVDADLTAELIGEFVASQSNKLRDIYEHLAADQTEVFVFQPETLVVFLALERDHYRCRELWAAELPEDLLEHFAAVWGVAV